jgi:phage terminase large subunit
MRTLDLKTARVFAPLLEPARYKGAHGGRGSGKSHFFGEMLIEDCLYEPGASGGEGLRSLCLREVQKDLSQSSKALLEAKLSSLNLGGADGFRVYKDVITTPGDGLIIFKGMNDYTADSVKSLEGFKRAWWAEAQTATQRSLDLLRPTMRATGSQLWFDWNPRFAMDPVDRMLRSAELPTGALVVQANWRDNPFFPAELEQERLDCLRQQPDKYDHIWEGGYETVNEGAYFAKQLTAAKAEGRLGVVAADPSMRLRAYVDIGGTGRNADSFAMWIAQFVGLQVRVLDYYEAQGQPMATHVQWLHDRSYKPDRLDIWLPHDGDRSDVVFAVTPASELRRLGYTVTTIPNQGKGAALKRVEAARQLFPSIWFNQESCSGGLAALGWYHEKRDEKRGIGLGPEHDWASHGADAFGLMCCDWQPPKIKTSKPAPVASGWMG